MSAGGRRPAHHIQRNRHYLRREAPLLRLHRRLEGRPRYRHRRGPTRQRLRDRIDAGRATDQGGSRSDLQRGDEFPGRLRGQGECHRHRARLLRIHRRGGLRPGTRHRPGRRRQCLRGGRDCERRKDVSRAGRAQPDEERLGRLRGQGRPAGKVARLLRVHRRSGVRGGTRHRSGCRRMCVRGRSRRLRREDGLPGQGRPRPHPQRRAGRLRGQGGRQWHGTRLLRLRRRKRGRCGARRRRGSRRLRLHDRLHDLARPELPGKDRTRSDIQRIVRWLRGQGGRQRHGARLLRLHRRIAPRPR